MPGSIEWRSDTSCRISIPNGYMGGKKKWVRETMSFTKGETRTQMVKLAEARKAELYIQTKQGALVSSRQYTLKEFSELWLAEYAPTEGLSPVTVAGYKDLLDGRILPALGHVKLHQLTAPQLTQFYRKLLSTQGKGYCGKGKKLSASTVLHYHRLIRSMLNTAVRWGIIPINPALRATTPKNDAKKMKAYNPQEAAAMLEKLQKEPLSFQAGILLALMGQLRKGEIAGLEWKDVDWEGSTLRIERSAVYLSGQGVIVKTPKTESGIRTIAL